MPIVRLRINGTDTAIQTLLQALEGIEGIEHIEQIEDLMPHMDDDDSSSAGLSDDMGGDYAVIEVDAPNETGVRRVIALSEEISRITGSVIEVLDEDDELLE